MKKLKPVRCILNPRTNIRQQNNGDQPIYQSQPLFEKEKNEIKEAFLCSYFHYGLVECKYIEYLIQYQPDTLMKALKEFCFEKKVYLADFFLPEIWEDYIFPFLREKI